MLMKIKLNRDIVRESIRSSIEDSIMFEEKNINAFAKRRVNDVINYIIQKAKESGDDDEIIRLAKEYGINLDQLRGIVSKEEFKKNRDQKVNDTFNNLSNPESRDNSEKIDEITVWVKQYLDTLRKCCVGKNFSKDFDRTTYDKNGELKRDDNGEVVMHNAGDSLKPNSENSNKWNFDSIEDPKVKYNVILLKDFLDKIGLTALYREAPIPKSVKERAGVQLNQINPNTPVDQLTLDFGSLCDDEILAYFSPRRNKTFKAAVQSVIDNNPDQKTSNKELLDNNTMLKSLAKNGLLKQRAERYVDRTYGVSLTFGEDNGMFKFGNNKIHDDTLVVNFQSALRCPAWNQCIMKDACYAKTSEVNYDDTLSSNLKKGFIWEQTKTDPKLMKLMCVLIRSCMINYIAAGKKIAQIAKDKGIDILNLAGETYGDSPLKDKFTKALASVPFSVIKEYLGDEAITILSNNKNGTLIRLNENGDFIGQWLVDAWEKMAEDFSLVGIHVAAYTCRALNYTKVKHMILNISQANIVRGQDSSHFAHYFYAISHDEYNKLGETYTGPNYSFMINNNYTITPVFRKLFNENGEIVGYYYKCPCGRGKFTYQPIDVNAIPKNDMESIVKYESIPVCFEDSDKYILVDGTYYKRTKTGESINKADCYMCRICYGRETAGDIKIEGNDDQDMNLPVFVFVATHGSNSGEFEEEIADARKMLGHDVKYWINLQSNTSNMTSQEDKPQELNENEEIDMSDNSGANNDTVMKQITKNFTTSVANMMNKMSNKLNEIKTNFFKTLNKLS